ncbi:hypothetical protein Pmani_005467 [Petrolisthes manimaculis]|uniref:Uncharacterized protein n=1 Tax=Petrolisthes manimaculis TaxID=1843537 RepID=A0AAE1QEH0_9EUCA|nr:hypothetical protein Pmani_005467 [Petrolisthes manimaculis]
MWLCLCEPQDSAFGSAIKAAEVASWQHWNKTKTLAQGSSTTGTHTTCIVKNYCVFNIITLYCTLKYG